MVDFTVGMIVHNLSKGVNYATSAYKLFGITSEDREFDYLFFNELAPTQSIGGFKKNEKGTTVDDINESGYLNNCTINPNEVISSLGYISPEHISEYAKLISSHKTL